jgi:hypothetical protein
MQQDNMLYNRKPQTCSAEFLGTGFVYNIKPLEYP